MKMYVSQFNTNLAKIGWLRNSGLIADELCPKATLWIQESVAIKVIIGKERARAKKSDLGPI